MCQALIGEMMLRIKNLEENESRIVALEEEVERLKTAVFGGELVRPQGISAESVEEQEEARPKDKTKYKFRQRVYSKRGLVLAVVSRYVAEHHGIGGEELSRVFAKELQGGFGVVRPIGETFLYQADPPRFFNDVSDILHLRDGDYLICNQWGKENIKRFVERARQLGYEIEEISR